MVHPNERSVQFIRGSFKTTNTLNARGRTLCCLKCVGPFNGDVIMVVKRYLLNGIEIYTYRRLNKIICLNNCTIPNNSILFYGCDENLVVNFFNYLICLRFKGRSDILPPIV